jgi:hypothetical protein
MKKPHKPNTKETLTFVCVLVDDAPAFLLEEAVNAFQEDAAWDRVGSLSVEDLRRLIAPLSAKYKWEVWADDDCIMLTGERERTPDELQAEMTKYTDALAKYELWLEEQREVKKQKSLENKKKQLAKLKKELGE